MRFSKNNLYAMTLVEILVVLGIIIAISALTIVVINPAKQRARSQDAILKNSIASLGQAIDSFYGLHGYYPDPNEATQVVQLQRFISSGFDLLDTSPSGQLDFTNPSVFTAGVAGGTITYYSHDFDLSTSSLDLPCIEGVSNENPTTEFIAWAPGFAVKTLVLGSCNTQTGYTELTGLDPL